MPLAIALFLGMVLFWSVYDNSRYGICGDAGEGAYAAAIEIDRRGMINEMNANMKIALANTSEPEIRSIILQSYERRKSDARLVWRNPDLTPSAARDLIKQRCMESFELGLDLYDR